MNTIQIEYPLDLPDYELLDSGEGEKLERFHKYKIVRPDPRAIWHKSLKTSIWLDADARFQRTTSESGVWQTKTPPPTPWLFHYKQLSFNLKPTDFKHVGIFPEQAVNWDWMTDQIHGHAPSILNLFAYTGGATIVAANSGAIVTHVDSSKSSITWANNNAKHNMIPTQNIRWIEDDAVKFVQREIKRGKTYDGLIMDPPRFGRGSKGEIWKLEEHLPNLINLCKQILSKNPLFVLINAYTADLSSLVLKNLMEDLMDKSNGTITFGELTSKESTSGRLLPQGIFARWQR
jgi:23S rRNA (cytosine1962-C5)-methyltransferase